MKKKIKFYTIPTISSSKYYYSFYTSFGFILLYFYLQCYQKCASILYHTILLVGIVSSIHHIRSFEDDYNDMFRYIDIVLATCFTLLMVFFYWNQVLICFGILLVVFFFYIQTQITSPKKQSIFHAWLHLLVISLVLLTVNNQP